VRGDLQQQTHQDTYAATLAAWIFRSLMAVTAAFDLEAYQLDAISAFTNSDLDEVVHCKYPEGFERDGYCLLLLRALYGLRRSPLLWLKELSRVLTVLGFHQVPEEPCLFTDNRLIIFFFVDDIVILCHSKDIPRLRAFQETITERYEMRDLGELT